MNVGTIQKCKSSIFADYFRFYNTFSMVCLLTLIIFLK